jgi:hypothetical protein
VEGDLLPGRVLRSKNPRGQTVRETFTCRACEKISQPPAPFHTIPRGWAGPHLIAMVAATLRAIVIGRKQSQIDDLLPWNYAVKV